MRRWAALAAVFAAGLALPVVALSQSGAPEAPATAPASTKTPAGETGQVFFRDQLPKDPKVSGAIRRALTSGAAFVDPATQFGDLTGDGKADAIVRVDTGGAGGAIAVYVFSTDGGTSSKLRIVYANQRLYRVVTTLRGAELVLSVPVYKPGDEPGRPSRLAERTYAWDKKAKTLHRTATRTVTG